MPVVARWTRARMNSSPSSNKPRRRSRPLWRSSGRCKGVHGPTGSTSGCGIGVHRGRPTLTDTGYVGLAVHAAARICYAAHGGQIVVSSSVHSAVLASLADGVTLRSLGAFRFQGLREPEQLYQLVAGDLLTEFPPLRPAVPGHAA